METWLWAEGNGTTLAEEPRISSTQFGDGYEQTAVDGLNPIRQEWSFTFKGMDAATGDEMIAFLRARVSALNGLEPFLWTPLWSTTAITVTARKWTRTAAGDYGFSDIAVTFRQWFGP